VTELERWAVGYASALLSLPPPPPLLGDTAARGFETAQARLAKGEQRTMRREPRSEGERG